MTDTAPEASLDLASLLCSRLCHDLMSPVGAIANGLELLADETDTDMRARCLSLLEQSARTAADKLRFFRTAFGATGGPGADEALPVAELTPLVEALARGPHPIAVTWLIDEETLPLSAAKVLLNLALIGVQGLVRGGSLDCGAERTGGGEGMGGAIDIVVRASATRVVFDPEIGRALDGSLTGEGLSSRTAAAAMVQRIAAARGGGVQHMMTGDTLLLGATLPADGTAQAGTA